MRGGGDVRRGEAVFLCEFVGFARLAEDVAHPDELDRAGMGGGERFRDSAAEAAMDIVILSGDDGAGFPFD